MIIDCKHCASFSSYAHLSGAALFPRTFLLHHPILSLSPRSHYFRYLSLWWHCGYSANTSSLSLPASPSKSICQEKKKTISYFSLLCSFHFLPSCTSNSTFQTTHFPPFASLSPSSLLLWPFRIIIAFQVNFEHFCLFSSWPVKPSGVTVPAPEMMGLDAPIPLFMRQHTDEFTFQNQLAVHVKLIALALVVSRPHVFPCLFRPLSPRFSDPPLLASSLSFSLQPSLPICASSFAPSPLFSSQERSAPSSSSSRRSPSKNPSTLCYSPLPSRSCFSPSDSHKTFCLKGVKEALSAFSCL